MLRFGLAAIVVLAVAGCSVLIDSTRLTGGTGATADASSADVTVATATDAAGTADTNADAAVSRRLCDLADHDVCTDFDGVDALDGFVDFTGKSEGRIGVSKTRFVSAPQSLFATLPRRETARVHSTAVAHMKGAFARTVVEMDVYIVEPAFLQNDSNAGIFCLNFVDDTGDAHGTCLSVAKDFTSYAGKNAQAFPFDRWAHVRFDIDPFAKEATFSLEGIDTKGSIEVPAGAPLLTMIEIGVLGYNVPAPEFNVYIDNLTADRL